MANTKLTTNNKAKKTTVFMKQAMAVSGLFFVLFLILHSYGNLKVFMGQEAYNEYALHLRTFLMPILPYEGLLWILRLALLACLVIHAGSALHLWAKASKARGSRYVVKKSLAQAYAARTMRWGGVILLLFIVFHLAHFTLKWVTPGDVAAYETHSVFISPTGQVLEAAAPGAIEVAEGNPYAMMFTSFHEWWIVLIYAIALAALCLHIAHGVWSALQSLGWLRRSSQGWVTVVSGLVGVGVFLMFVLPPVAIAAGLVPPPVGM